MFSKWIALLSALLCLKAQGADLRCFQTLAHYHYGDDAQCPAAAFALIVATSSDQMPAVEDAVLGALNTPGATAEGRALLCRILGRIGSEKCIPAAIGLLSDEVLADDAMAVMEHVGSPAAATALRNALDQAPVQIKLGLLGSLGGLRDAASVEKIARLAADPDSVLASAAIRALGKIGGEAAVSALQSLTVPESLRRPRDEALLEGARSLSDKSAGAVYLKVLSASDAVCNPGALMGLLRADPVLAVAKIKEALRDGDAGTVAGILTWIAADKGGERLIPSIGAGLDEVPAGLRPPLIRALGASRNPQALIWISPKLTDADAEIRKAAVEALGKIGAASALKPRQGLDVPKGHSTVPQMTEAAVNATLLELLKDRDLTRSVIATLVARNATEAVPALLELTSDPDATVRTAAWQGLQRLANETHIQALCKTAFAVTDPKDSTAALAAVKSVCALAVNKRQCFEPVQAAYEGGTDPVKKAILDIGRAVGSTRALELEIKAVHSHNPSLASAAIKALSHWPNNSVVPGLVAPSLLEMATAAPREVDQHIALWGYIDIASNEDVKMTRASRCDMFQKAGAIARHREEKIKIVDGLALAESPDFYPLIRHYIQDPETRDEAERIGLQVLADLNQRDTPDAQALAKLLAASSNQIVSEKAEKFLRPH